MKQNYLKQRDLAPLISKLQLTPLLDNGVKMTSKRRSFILLIFIIKCISKCYFIYTCRCFELLPKKGQAWNGFQVEFINYIRYKCLKFKKL